MNYLAHAYLSFEDPEILAGNMISDFVKGKKKFDYPLGIQRGIALHRAIDNFTDEHEINRLARDIFRPVYRLYSGAMVDVIYDHFLAADHHEFSDASLLEFSLRSYAVLETQAAWFPERFSRMFFYMKTQNWLYHYRHLPGTERSLEGLVRRAAYLTESRPAYQLLEQHYQLFQQYYRQFWADLKPFARDQYERLIRSHP